MRLLVGFTCVVLSVGCSDDDKVRHLADAPPPEVDASPFGPVTLTILQGTDPRTGVRVIFQNADSTTVLETTTGTDGKAGAMMLPGGYVTAIDPFPNQGQGVATADLRTFAGVKPGDQLRLFEQPLIQPTAINLNVALPIENTAASYRVSTNCFFGHPIDTSGSGPLQLSGCGPTSNLLVEAVDNANNSFKSFYKQSVPLVDNGTLDLTGETFAAIPDVTFTYTNVPAALTSVFVNGVRATSLGTIYELNGNANVEAGTATLTTKVPEISNATAVTASSFGSSGVGFTQHMISEWGPASATYTLDTSGMFLPEFDSIATLDHAAHSVKWTSSGGSVQPDFVFVRAFLGRESPLQSWRWTIVAPAGAQAVLPVLPDSSTYNPIAGDFGSFDVRTGKVPGGYDAVRENILATSGLQGLTEGATGKASFTFLVEASGIKPPLRGFTRRSR